MSKLIEKATTSSPLPSFNSVLYPQLDKSFLNTELMINRNGGAFDKVREYRYQLPDVGNYQLYITCDTNGIAYRKATRKEHAFPIFGYLVIHDQQKKEAKFLLVYFKGLGGIGSKRRVFRIDFEGRLLVRDFVESATGEHLSASFEIAIKENGHFVLGKTALTNSRKPSRKMAKLTGLPFNADYGPNEMYNKLCKQSARSYLLPAIKKLRYIPIDSAYETKETIEGFPFESIFNFSSYRFRFPNIHGKYVFLVTDTTLATYNTKLEGYSTKSGMYPPLFLTHGYLLIYDPVLKTADVLNVYLMMGGRRRTFNIDSGYLLSVSDFVNSEEDDKPGEFLNRALIDLANLSVRKLTID